MLTVTNYTGHPIAIQPSTPSPCWDINAKAPVPPQPNLPGLSSSNVSANVVDSGKSRDFNIGDFDLPGISSDRCHYRTAPSLPIAIMFKDNTGKFADPLAYGAPVGGGADGRPFPLFAPTPTWHCVMCLTRTPIPAAGSARNNYCDLLYGCPALSLYPTRWLPANPYQTAGSSGATGPFCITAGAGNFGTGWDKWALTLTIRSGHFPWSVCAKEGGKSCPGSHCRPTSAPRSSSQPMAQESPAQAGRAPAETPVSTPEDKAGVFDLFNIASALCAVLKPSPAWGSDCASIKEGKNWDLSSLKANVRNRKMEGFPAPTPSQKIVDSGRANLGPGGSYTFAATESRGTDYQTNDCFTWHAGQRARVRDRDIGQNWRPT